MQQAGNKKHTDELLVSLLVQITEWERERKKSLILWQKQLNSLSVIQFYDKSFSFFPSFHGGGNKHQTFMWDFFEELKKCFVLEGYLRHTHCH